MHKLYRRLAVAPENTGLLTVIYLAFFNSGMMAIMQGTALPYLREDHALTYAQSGMMLSAHQVGNLCAVLLAGVLPYLIGRKRSTLLLGSGIVVGMLGVTLTGNPLLLVVAYAFTGISRGTMSNICNAVVSDVAGNRTGALNILHAAFAVGALLSPLLILFSEGVGLGWRGGPRIIALLAVAVLVLVGRSALPGKPTPRERGGSLAFLRDRSFWLGTGILFFYLCAEASIVGWLVLYFTDTGLLPPAVAAITPTLLWLMIMLGRMACAALSTRVNRDRLSLALGLLFTLCFGLMLAAQTPALCVAALLGIGLSMAGIYPTTFASMGGTSSTVVTGSVIALATLGAIVMPSVVGAVADARGLAGGVAAILVALVLMVALMVVKLVPARRRSAAE